MQTSNPLSRFIGKLASRCNISLADREAIRSLSCVQIRVKGGSAVVSPANKLCLGIVNEGFVTTFKIVQKQRIQVISFAMAGDAIDLPAVVLGKSCVHATAQVPTLVTWIPHDDLLQLFHPNPQVAQAFWLDAVIDANMAHEWAANMGQRKAKARVGHLLLELNERFFAAGLTSNAQFELPMSQSIMASALGMSVVHYNKSLAALSQDGLITSTSRRINILDAGRLKAAIGFDSAYLCLVRYDCRTKSFREPAVCRSNANRLQKNLTDDERATGF